MAMHSSTKASPTFFTQRERLKDSSSTCTHTEREEKRLFNVVEQRNKEQLFILARARPFIKMNYIAVR